MSGSFPFPIHLSHNTSSGADGDTERTKVKPFRCGDCEQDFSAICLLHTHLRGGSYHYDEETMTAFPLSGTTCASVFKRMKTETPKVTPDSTRKIFKIKKIRKKGLQKQSLADSDEEWTPSTEEYNRKQSGHGINEYQNAFNVTPSIETVNDEADSNIHGTDYTEMELDEHGQSSSQGISPKKNKRQLVINLYGMDRNEDGSLRLVVGEKDSGVFKTAAGDAILKALKLKGKMFKGHMKVIYNYPDNIPDSDIEEEADEDLEEDVDESDENDTPKKIKTRSTRKGRSASKTKTDEKSDTITIEPISPLSSESSAKAVVKATSKEIAPRTSGDPTVFKMAEERLSTMEATDILNEILSGHHLEDIIRTQIPRPRGGEVYLMDLEGLPKTKERKVDTYKWNNCGSKKYPKSKEVIIKTVYKVKLPNGYFSDVFVKHFYQMLETPRYCVIHYIGDPPVI